MNRLEKSSTDKALFGVCAGIAEYFGINPLIVRLIFVFLPVSFLIYLILAALLPDGKLPSIKHLRINEWREEINWIEKQV